MCHQEENLSKKMQFMPILMPKHSPQILSYMKKIIVFSALLFGVTVSTAQDLGSVLLASDDSNRLLQNYLNPAMKGLMSSMNGGWYSTAKSHKKFGFDITFGLNAAFTPNKDKVFEFIANDYNFISHIDGDTNVPTVLGNDNANTSFDVLIPYDGGDFKAGSFELPGGIAKDLPANAVPTPFVQVGLGLPFKTTIKLRYVPKVNFSSKSNANLLGVGLQHDLTQYLGLVGKLPFSVSLFGAYTTSSVNYSIENGDVSDQILVSNGSAQFKLNTWTVQALGSLDFKIVTLYGSVGLNGGKSTFNINGDYDLTYQIESADGTNQGSIVESISDPLSLKFNSSETRATLGARLNLAFLKIFADYTLQEYNTATLGVAFSFR